MSKQKSCSGWREIIIARLFLTTLPASSGFHQLCGGYKICVLFLSLLQVILCLLLLAFAWYLKIYLLLSPWRRDWNQGRKSVNLSLIPSVCLLVLSEVVFFEGQLSPPCIAVILWLSGSCLNTHTVSAFQHLCVGAALSMVLFAGQLSGQNQQTVGTLDLGGASTQITFLPRFEVRSG